MPSALVRLICGALFACSVAVDARAQEAAPLLLELTLRRTETLPLPGLTHVIALDESICEATAAPDELRLSGKLTGETVLIAWIHGVRASIVVRVTPPRDVPRPPALSPAAVDALGRGRSGMAVTTHSQDGGAAPAVSTHEYWEWQQTRGGGRLSVRGLGDSYPGSRRGFNLSALAIQHATARRTLSLMDFTLSLGPAGTSPVPMAQYGGFAVRGFDYVAARGRTRWEIFGGATVPSHFLSFAATRGIVGAKVERRINARLGLVSSVGAVNAPVTPRADAPRATTAFQVTGVTFAASPSLLLSGTAGASTRGLMGEFQADYRRGPFTGSMTATDSSPTFPLNQFQLLAAPESSVRAAATVAWARFSASTTVRHATVKNGAIAVFRGSSDSVAQHVAVTLPFRQQLSLNASRAASTGSPLTDSVQTRLDGSWSVPVGRRLTNTFQAGMGRRTESSGLNAYEELTLRDSATLSLPFGSIALSVEHQRLDPSMPGRIRQVLDQLPSGLQQLYHLDPLLFLDTVTLPADIHDLLGRVQPTSTTISGGLALAHRRLSVTPTVSVVRDAVTGETSRRSVILGYSATWQLSSRWQVRSLLSNRLLYSPLTRNFTRSYAMTVGLDASFTGLPGWLPVVTSARTIEGRVFRDANVNGLVDEEEPGLPGVKVRLDGRRTATTDAAGRFRFSDVPAGLRRVSVDPTQFAERVRVTTPSEVDVEVTERVVRVDFGIVNFAQITGVVFNDYSNDGKRIGDAPGLAGVTVRLSAGSITRTTRTDAGGTYELTDVPPGEYTLTVLPDDLPADYLVAASDRHVRVEPLATAIADLPVRALRSISGRVLIKAAVDAPADSLEPLAGARIVAASVSAVTDEDGQFVLRDLPAGVVEVRVVPLRDLPERLQAPSGSVRLKIEPHRLENVRIVITNTELIPYLSPAPEPEREPSDRYREGR